VDSPNRRWRATIWARNVMDKYYWINQLRIGDTTAKVTGMPATFGGTFTYRFN
jgi:outer membrane receptor protein involved in Fe transport